MATGHAKTRRDAAVDEDGNGTVGADAHGLEAGLSGFVHGIRVGLVRHAEQSARWEVEGACAAGCGCKADARHVIMGRCRDTRYERDGYNKKVHGLLQALVKAVPKQKNRAVDVPMREWLCECRLLVLRRQRRGRRGACVGMRLIMNNGMRYAQSWVE